MANSKTILIIDDEPVAVELLSAKLRENGYDVACASNGKEGLNRVKERTPDLIISDVLMPEMDGFTLYKELKKNEETSNIPVVILTDRGKMEDTFVALGASSFVAKPIDIHNILSEIRRLLKQPSPGTKEVLPDNQEPVTKIETVAADGKKVLIWGTHQKTFQEIAGKLQAKNCQITILKEAARIISEVDTMAPHLILLELSLDGEVPVDRMVGDITDLMKRKMKESSTEKDRSSPFERSPVVLYKVEEEVSGVSSIGEDMATTENLLDNCAHKGQFKYIGSYSSVSFLSKIEEFL